MYCTYAAPDHPIAVFVFQHQTILYIYCMYYTYAASDHPLAVFAIIIQHQTTLCMYYTSAASIFDVLITMQPQAILHSMYINAAFTNPLMQPPQPIFCILFWCHLYYSIVGIASCGKPLKGKPPIPPFHPPPPYIAGFCI